MQVIVTTNNREVIKCIDLYLYEKINLAKEDCNNAELSVVSNIRTSIILSEVPGDKHGRFDIILPYQNLNNCDIAERILKGMALSLKSNFTDTDCSVRCYGLTLEKEKSEELCKWCYRMKDTGEVCWWCGKDYSKYK